MVTNSLYQYTVFKTKCSPRNELWAMESRAGWRSSPSETSYISGATWHVPLPMEKPGRVFSIKSSVPPTHRGSSLLVQAGFHSKFSQLISICPQSL